MLISPLSGPFVAGTTCGQVIGIPLCVKPTSIDVKDTATFMEDYLRMILIFQYEMGASVLVEWRCKRHSHCHGR